MQGQSNHFGTNALCQLPGLWRAPKSHKLCGLVLEHNIMLYYNALLPNESKIFGKISTFNTTHNVCFVFLDKTSYILSS